MPATSQLLDGVLQRLSDLNIPLDADEARQAESIDDFLELLFAALGGDRGQKGKVEFSVQLSTLADRRVSDDEAQWIERRARRHSVR